MLLLAPSFLADRRHKRIHGAEIFNLLLVRELIAAGAEVTVAHEHHWSPRLAEHLGDLTPTGRLRMLGTPPLRKPLPCSAWAAARLAFAPPFDLVILGNVARGVLPAARLLRWTGRARSLLVISHQYPRADYLRSLRRLPVSVMAASGPVARVFREAGPWPVEVSYGVQNPERFFPRQGPRPQGPVRFCLVGVLDTPWKGADLALRAWDLLEPPVRRRAELHLLSYKEPPAFRHREIVHHPWVAPNEVGAWLRGMDAMLVPSTAHETFSQVMAQGMLTALPQVVYDLEVLTEKLDAGGGLIFRRPEELAGHITTLVEDEPARLRMGQDARRTALERYIWRVGPFAERYLGGSPPTS